MGTKANGNGQGSRNVEKLSKLSKIWTGTGKSGPNKASAPPLCQEPADDIDEAREQAKREERCAAVGGKRHSEREASARGEKKRTDQGGKEKGLLRTTRQAPRHREVEFCFSWRRKGQEVGLRGGGTGRWKIRMENVAKKKLRVLKNRENQKSAGGKMSAIGAGAMGSLKETSSRLGRGTGSGGGGQKVANGQAKSGKKRWPACPGGWGRHERKKPAQRRGGSGGGTRKSFEWKAPPNG